MAPLTWPKGRRVDVQQPKERRPQTSDIFIEGYFGCSGIEPSLKQIKHDLWMNSDIFCIYSIVYLLRDSTNMYSLHTP